MKLSTPLVQETLQQLEEQAPFEDAQAIPDDHPVVPQLKKAFGEHTFFVDSDGLHIVEPVEHAAGDVRLGQVVKLAAWGDETQTNLTAHEPERTDVIIVLGSEEPDTAS